VAFNFSRQKHLEHATRYDRAREFVALIKELWDSWEDDALADGRLDGEKVHAIDHRGDWFSVRGPLDVPRPAQGHPVIIQAGQSDDGRDLAARIADVIFSPFRDLAESKAHYDDIKARMLKYGRDPEALRVLPGLSVTVAPTEAEAKEKAANYRELLFSDSIVRYLLGEQSGLDFADIDLDGPFPALDASDPNANGPLVTRWNQLAREQGLTARQLGEQAIPRGGLVGTPAQIADHIERWVDAGASDGFLLAPQLFPGDLDDFVDLVVPELQARGRFRSDYSGSTLREHLDVPRPASPWVSTKA
jgi:alkanesulfonate monooxygenase